jgi:hypothetical protein
MSEPKNQLLSSPAFALLNNRASTALRLLTDHKFPCLEAPTDSITVSCRPKDSAWHIPFHLPPLQHKSEGTHERWEWTESEEIRIDLLLPIEDISCDPVVWFAATQGSNFGDIHVHQLLSAPLCGAELDWSQITEKGLTQLCSISTLSFLDISWTKLPAMALVSLAQLKNIRCLKLNAHHITPDVINVLNTLPIEVLHLNQCRVQALAQLKIPTLRALWLCDSNITDADLQCVEGCPNIERMELRGSGVRGVRMHPLRSAHSLKILNLSSTNIHNNALSSIHDLPNLIHLDISYTPIDDWHIQNFKENRMGFSLPPTTIQATR